MTVLDLSRAYYVSFEPFSGTWSVQVPRAAADQETLRTVCEGWRYFPTDHTGDTVWQRVAQHSLHVSTKKLGEQMAAQHVLAIVEKLDAMGLTMYGSTRGLATYESLKQLGVLPLKE